MSKYQSNEVVSRVATRYGVEPSTLFPLLKATAFKQKNGLEPTDEQVLSILIVADMFGLNPFANEIYAVPNDGDVIPVVGVDGWAKVVNNQPQFDGVEFEYAKEMVSMPGALVEAPMWIECVVYRKDRSKPIRVREYLDEVYQLAPIMYDPNGNEVSIPGHWQTHTKRQLRHKGFVQANRIAFGLTGIYDPDEANRIKASSLPVASQAQLQQAASVVSEAEVVAHIKEDDVKAEVKAEADTDAKAEVKAEADTDAKAEVKAKADTDAKAEVKAKADTDAKAQMRQQLAKLIQMAQERQMWIPAFDYVKAKFAKDNEQLEIAISIVEEAKNEAERTEAEASMQTPSEEVVEQNVKAEVVDEVVAEDADGFF